MTGRHRVIRTFHPGAISLIATYDPTDTFVPRYMYQRELLVYWDEKVHLHFSVLGNVPEYVWD